jgi:hypothetical protein
MRRQLFPVPVHGAESWPPPVDPGVREWAERPAHLTSEDTGWILVGHLDGA